MTFLKGPRRCIGESMVELQLASLVHRILLEYNLEYHHPRLVFQFFLFRQPFFIDFF